MNVKLKISHQQFNVKLLWSTNDAAILIVRHTEAHSEGIWA